MSEDIRGYEVGVSIKVREGTLEKLHQLKAETRLSLKDLIDDSVDLLLKSKEEGQVNKDEVIKILSKMVCYKCRLNCNPDACHGCYVRETPITKKFSDSIEDLNVD